MKSPKLRFTKKVGIRLREFREMLGKSQTDFGSRIEITREKLASIEAGRVPLRWGDYQTLWEEWKLSGLWLGSGSGHPTTPDSKQFAAIGAPPQTHFESVFETYCAVIQLAPEGGARAIDLERLNAGILGMRLELQRLTWSAGTVRERLLANAPLRESFADLADEIAVWLAIVEREHISRPGEVGHELTAKSGRGKDSKEIGLTSPRSVDYSPDMPTTIPDWETLRGMIAEITKKQGSRNDLIKDFGVSKQTASAWLNGTREPDANTTIALLRWCEKGGKK